MPSDDERPGSKTVRRLTDRLDRSQLRRQAVPGGGAVYRGPVASRALEALGARAMTVDQQIVVSDDFDPSKPEDRALLAHEQYHVDQGDGLGGGGGENFRDAEEIAARAVERMVLHRLEGGPEPGIQPGAGAREALVGLVDPVDAAAGEASSPNAPDVLGQSPNSSRGYGRLRAKGLSRAAIIEDLARQAVGTLDAQAEVGLDRQADKRGTFSST